MKTAAPTNWKGTEAVILDTFDATALLAAPFTVIVKHSVKAVLDTQGQVIETIIPDPDGLVKAVAQARVLHPHKLTGVELKFLRSALGLKAKDLAKEVQITPEHMSRLESGDKVLTPQVEMLIRIYTFVSTLRFTARKDQNAVKIAGMVSNVFGALSIQSCHSIEDEMAVILTRPRVSLGSDTVPDEGGLWDEEAQPIAMAN